MTGKWVGVLSLVAIVAAALNLGGNSSGPQTPALSMLSQAMLADTQTAVVGNGSPSSSTAADAQCPKANSEEKTGYYPDKPWNADFKDGGYTYHNLYGKPCQGPFVKAFCRKENFCDGAMAGSQCESNGVWGACKEESAAPVQVACSTPGGCAVGQLGNPPPPPAASTQTSGPGSAANTQPTPPPAGSTPAPASPAAPAQPAALPTANSGISAIANSGSQTTAPVPPSGSVSTGPVASPVPPTPTGPAFQSPSYLPAGTPPTGAPAIPAVPTSPYAQPIPNTWSPGYNSAQYPGGSSPVAVATNQQGGGPLFSFMMGLFGGLFGGNSSGASGSSHTSSASTQAPIQTPPVQTIIQLYVIGSPTTGVAAHSTTSATAPVAISNIPNVTSYDVTSLGTPPVNLEGTFPNALAEGSLQKLIALTTPAPVVPTESNKSDTSHPSTTPAQPSVNPLSTLPHADSLSSALVATSTQIPSYATDTTQISFVQPYAVSATAPAGSNGFSPALNLIDIYAGGWAGGKVVDPGQALLENRAALAQLQSNYEGTQAALSAWQALADSGLCAESCQTTIAALQSQVPSEELQMKKLSDAVYQGAAALSRTPAIDNGIAGLARNPEHAALLLSNGEQTVQHVLPEGQGGLGGTYESSTSPDTVIKTIAQYALPPVGTSSTDGDSLVVAEVQSGHSSSGLPELLSHLWSVLTSWLAPSASSTPSGIGCSLLGSLFGFCTKS